MNSQKVIPLLQAIVQRERDDGCTMADEQLIEPALRRWRSYDRRNKRNKDKSLKHRAHDLEKCFIELYPDLSYDPGCLRHLAESFAKVLFTGLPESSSETTRQYVPTPAKLPTTLQQTVSNSEIEMRWITAWEQLYEILGDQSELHCRLPDGSIITVEQCKAWLQSSVYSGYSVNVASGWVRHSRGVVVSRTMP